MIVADGRNSANFEVSHGFWRDFGEEVLCLAGHVNFSDFVRTDDVVYLIISIFGGRPVKLC